MPLAANAWAPIPGSARLHDRRFRNGFQLLWRRWAAPEPSDDNKHKSNQPRKHIARP
jgi:hypothetical protein